MLVVEFSDDGCLSYSTLPLNQFKMKEIGKEFTENENKRWRPAD